MFLLDTLLVAPFTFVLRRIAEAVEAELDNPEVLRDELLAAQMRLELGEIDEAEFAALERELLARMRVLRAPADESGAGVRITGVEVRVGGDEDLR